MNRNKIEKILRNIDNCPICKSIKLTTIGDTRTINPHSDLKVQIIKCHYCLHWFINPMIKQEDLNTLYSEASDYVVTKNWLRNEFSIPEEYIIKNESKKNSKKKKYLEIGIGYGLLFKYFQKKGYYCFGVEPYQWAIDIPNIVDNITKLNEDNFEVIVLVDVLEHLEDPLLFIEHISQLSIKGGTVYASFPNNQSLQALLFKKKWRMIRPFGHLHYFSEKSLKIMFESNRFKIKHLKKTDLFEFKIRNYLKPPYFMSRAIAQWSQSLWGDQWIVRAIKN